MSRLIPLWPGVAQDLQGNALPGAIVQVKDHLSGALATIYTDEAGATPKTQPFSAGSQGEFSFYATAGRYDIIVTSGSFSQTIPNITIQEESTIAYLQNVNGDALALGAPVYVFGDGTVKKGQSDGTEAEAGVFAVCVESSLANSGVGRFRTSGQIPLAGTAGAIGYLSATGTITATPPVTGFSTIVGRWISNTVFLIDIQPTIGL